MINRKRLERKLIKKGWASLHIEKTLDIIAKANEKKHPIIILLDKMLYWIGLFTAIFGNLIISFSLIPVMVTMPFSILVLVTVFLGLCFGSLIDIFIRDIDYISKKHYIVAGIFIPALAFINLWMTYNYAKSFSAYLDILMESSPLLISILYIISFSLPHFLYQVIESIEKKELSESGYV